MFKISKNLLGLTVIISVALLLLTEQVYGFDYAYCEDSAYSSETECNDKGSIWKECTCYDSSEVAQSGWSHESCVSSSSFGYFEECDSKLPTTTTTTTPPTTTTTTTPPTTTTIPPSDTDNTDEEAIRRQQEEDARLKKLEEAKKAEEERLRKEAEERARKEAATRQFDASQQSQADAKTDENRVYGKNLGKLVHNRVMYVFAWRQGSIKSGIKTAKATQPTQTPYFRGIASGDKNTNYGSWITPASTWMKNKSATSKYDGNLFTVMAGGDFKLTENILIGTSVGYESLDLDTDYNDGSLKDNGFTFAPYFGYTITDYLIFDVMLGYTYLNNDMDRNRSSEPIKGSYDSHRFLISSNVNYYAMFQNWNLSAVLGYMYVNENEDAYQEIGGYDFDVGSQNIYLGEWRFGGRAGYFIKSFEPYISTAYLYDSVWNNGGSDRDELEGVLGCNYYPTDNLILSFEATNSFFRDDIENTRVNFNLHFDF